MSAMKQRLSQALSQRQKQHITDTSRVKSAVLLPVYHKQGQYYILFTKRTETVRNHKVGHWLLLPCESVLRK